MTRLLALALVATALAASACAGGDDATRVTLTADACTYDGPDSVDAGAVSLELENETGENGVFELARIAASSSFDELEAFVTEERRTPESATVVVQLEVDPGEVGVLTAGVTEGSYAVVCSNGPPATAIYATASFEAT